MLIIIGKKIVKKYSDSLSEGLMKTFLAGEVLADLGRFYFDEYLSAATDSYEFVSAIGKVAATGKDRHFILGFKTHVL